MGRAFVPGLVLALATAAAARAGEPAAVRVVDDLGRSVRLAAPPRRIVSTAPSNTAALFALGAGPRVVGVTTYCVDPPAARELPRVGDFSSLDLEAIVALEPDLVVATGLEQQRHVERMERLGLAVFVAYPASLAAIERSLEALGQAVGARERAGEMVADMRRRLAVVDAKVARIAPARRPRVFVELGRSPLYTAGPGSTVHEAVERAGGRNIAGDLGKPYATIGREAVVARDPEVIVVGMSGDAAGVGAEPGFAALAAVRNRRVHDGIDPAILFHHNHRLVEGVEALYRLFYPEE